LSSKSPSKTEFDDAFRAKAACREAVKEEPSLATAWDNVDVGTWEEDYTIPDPQSLVAKNICFACSVREACIRDALSDNEAEGIRGGFRFENGYITKEDARKLYNEFGLRGKVRREPAIRYIRDEDV
jgi:hypothetical protein